MKEQPFGLDRLRAEATLRIRLPFLASILVLLLIHSPSMLAQHVNLTGTWNVIREGGHRLSTVTFKQTGDRVEGTWSPENEPTSKIEDGSIHGDAFSCTVFRHDTQFKVTGIVHGAEISIDIAQAGSSQVVHATATRDISGGDAGRQ